MNSKQPVNSHIHAPSHTTATPTAAPRPLHSIPIAALLPISLAALLAAAPPARAQSTTEEVEPNHSKSTAQPITISASGDTITGFSRGSSTSPSTNFDLTADTFLLTLPVQPQSASAEPPTFGLIRWIATLTTAPNQAGHTLSLRGLSTVARTISPTSDATLQTRFVPSHSSSPVESTWYTLGPVAPRIFLRASGLSTTPANYTITLTTAPVAIITLGRFEPGPITITTAGQGHSTNTHIIVFGTDGSPITTPTPFANDDIATSTTRSTLTRTYPQGRYLLAIAPSRMATNVPLAADDALGSGAQADFPGTLIADNATANINVAFAINSSSRSINRPATRTDPFTVLWFSFDVGTPPPPPPAACNLADIASDSLDTAYNPNNALGPEDLDAFISGFIADNALIADVASDSLDTTRNPNNSVGPEDLDAFITAFITGC